jgi:hypothetical protein
MVDDRARDAFRKFGTVALEIKSSIDYGHLEGRAAEMFGIITALALVNTKLDLLTYQSLGAESVKLFTERCKWPGPATVIAAAKWNGITLEAREAELYLLVTRGLMEISAQEETGLTFDWYEVKD